MLTHKLIVSFIKIHMISYMYSYSLSYTLPALIATLNQFTSVYIEQDINKSIIIEYTNVFMRMPVYPYMDYGLFII